MNDSKDILDALYKLLGETPLPNTSDQAQPLEGGAPGDVALAGGGLEILQGESWLAADKDTWRSWTGHRRIWGIEYHGPVYNYLSPEGSPPFTGKRICNCSKCQSHVNPTLRGN